MPIAMRRLARIVLIANLALASSGCSRPPSAAPQAPNVATPASFGAPQTLAVGESVTYADGLQLLLKTINDSRCKPGEQCIWAGELAPVLRLKGGSIGNGEHELVLGTERAKEHELASYKIVLATATASSITLVVTKPGTQQAQQAHAKDDLIRITSPQTGQLVTSPLSVTGEARGPWYFEASFPLKLLDANGKLLVQTHAQAQGEWMTTEFVAFTSTLSFTTPATATGTLVLEKDNPSGEPQHDDSRSIPVRFKPH